MHRPLLKKNNATSKIPETHRTLNFLYSNFHELTICYIIILKVITIKVTVARVIKKRI